MNCKVPFNVEFLIEEFGNTFYMRDLREHRQKVLFETQKALLPETQQKLYNQLLREEFSALQRLFDVYRKLKNEEEIARIKKRQSEIIQVIGEATEASSSKQKKDRGPQAVRKCIDEACKGFIMKDTWQCGTCMMKVCRNCMQKDDPSHTCKDEDVETRKLLLNNTKPCPKCGAMICKVDGCDQMWCVLCHTTFSWRTGETVTSERVHNPHYYEWLRRTSSTMPREPGDIPICHQLPQARTLSAFVHGTPQFSSIMALHRILSHIQYAELPSLETRQRTFETERECYLEGKLDETAFKNALGLHEQKSDRCKALHDIFDLFYRQGIEEINAIVRGENPKTHLQVMEELRNYCNVQFAKTCRTFNIRKYEIADGFVAVRRVK